MTEKALDVLSPNPNGFFLVVEAGLIDWAAHDHDTGALLHEMIKFDESVAHVYEWAKGRRRPSFWSRPTTKQEVSASATPDSTGPPREPSRGRRSGGRPFNPKEISATTASLTPRVSEKALLRDSIDASS